MNNKLSLTLLLITLLTSSAIADEVNQNINFGLVNTSGNTDTLNVNGKYDLAYTTSGLNNEDLKVNFDTSAFMTENNSTRDNEEYRANLGLEQFIGNGWLGYISANWLKNKFLNFENKTSIGAGMGKELYNDGKQSLSAKLGIAYNAERYYNTQVDHDFTSANEYLEYNNKLNKTSLFFLKIGALENVDDFDNDYELLGSLGLNFAIAENISVTLAEEVRYDNLPPIGFKKTDTKSIVTVGYHF